MVQGAVKMTATLTATTAHRAYGGRHPCGGREEVSARLGWLVGCWWVSLVEAVGASVGGEVEEVGELVADVGGGVGGVEVCDVHGDDVPGGGGQEAQGQGGFVA